jgi:hypothetical protein
MQVIISSDHHTEKTLSRAWSCAEHPPVVLGHMVALSAHISPIGTVGAGTIGPCSTKYTPAIHLCPNLAFVQNRFAPSDTVWFNRLESGYVMLAFKNFCMLSI